jgi:hypothetical protein
MKTCPECNFQFQRRSKECCPNCKVRLVLSGKTLRILEDKQTVDEILLKIKRHVERRDGVELPFTLAEQSRERNVAYDLIKRTKVFLAAQKEKIPISPRDFLMGMLDYILSNLWWSEHLKSLLMLYNKIPEFAKEYFNKLKKRFISQNAEIERMVTTPKVSIEYVL